MKLIIVRHGQTASNAKNKLLGVTDEGITEVGYKQALLVKEKLKEEKIDLCFSSPLKRTMETAHIIVGDDFLVETDDRLLERGFGELEGGSSNKKYNRDFWNYYLNRIDYGVEPLQELFKRTNSFLSELKEKYPDKTILVVSHAATIRALHYNIVGFNESTYMLNFKVDNAQILQYNI